MARVTFDSLFRKNSDGSLEPTQPVRIGGVTMGPGVRFTRGVAFGGIDLAQYEGRELEIVLDNGVPVITGIY